MIISWVNDLGIYIKNIFDHIGRHPLGMICFVNDIPGFHKQDPIGIG